MGRGSSVERRTSRLILGAQKCQTAPYFHFTLVLSGEEGGGGDRENEGMYAILYPFPGKKKEQGKY